jgi:hypothetical protein
LAFFCAETSFCEGIRREPRYADGRLTSRENRKAQEMKKLLFVIMATTLAVSPVAAQKGQSGRLSESCRAEVKALCSSAQGQDARRSCIRENHSKVSDSCRAEMKARMDSRKATKAQAEGEAK